MPTTPREVLPGRKNLLGGAVEAERADWDAFSRRITTALTDAQQALADAQQQYLDAVNLLNSLPSPIGTIRRYTTNIGDGSATSFVVTHNLNNQDVDVAVREVAAPYAYVLPDILATTANTVTVTFTGPVPTLNQYRVIVFG